MDMHRGLLKGLLGILVLAGPLSAAPPEPTPEAVRKATVKALELIEKSAVEYTKHRECFSCHHQAVPLVALTTAKARGFTVSDEVVQQQLKFTAESLAKGKDNYRKGVGQGGRADTAGYALLALEAGGWQADDTTAAVAEYLLLVNKELDHWRTTSQRPPSEASYFTSSYVALRGLRAFATEEQKERRAARTDEVRRWLRKTPAKDNEDRVFRLWGLKLAGADDKDVQAAAWELVRAQRKDGGWSQTDDRDSDAYATGSALVVLHQAAGLKTDSSAYQQGLKFLLQAQQADGSWLVQSRSQPFQVYFESGFPHGKDQFISISASSWATAALALACPKP
jgi:hypothetical protein